jgi:MFS transporter, OPA family, glycerol-3-phosphate transporter
MNRKNSQRSLTFWQYQICALLYLSYAACYFGKLSVSSLTNQIIADPEGLTMEQVGVIGSSTAIGYSIGKIIATIVLDMFPATTVFPGIVLCVGLVNFLFSITYNYPVLVMLWGINGVLQGLSWVRLSLDSLFWTVAKTLN